MKKMIPDCYWPDSANGAYVSHEAVCVLNTNVDEVTVKLTLYFEDRAPLGGYRVKVPGDRTKHIRLDKLLNENGDPIPKATPYAMVVECDKEVGIQYTRVDTTQADLAIATTMV